MAQKCKLASQMQPFSREQVSCVTRAYRARAAAYRSKLAGDARAESNLSPGQLLQIQKALIEGGFLNDEADGEFGPTTRNAIKQYQQANGFPQSNFLSATERQALLAGPVGTTGVGGNQENRPAADEIRPPAEQGTQTAKSITPQVPPGQTEQCARNNDRTCTFSQQEAEQANKEIRQRKQEITAADSIPGQTQTNATPSVESPWDQAVEGNAATQRELERLKELRAQCGYDAQCLARAGATKAPQTTAANNVPAKTTADGSKERQNSSMDNSIIWLIIAGAAAVLLFRLFKRHGRSSQIRVAADWLQDLAKKGTQLKLICGEAPNIIFNNAEELLCVFPETTLLEPRAVRTWRGLYGGPSFRIAKGVSFRFGETRGTSESHDKLRALDRGTLVLTNQRLIFVGLARTTAAPLEKIIDVESYSDGVLLHREGKERAQFFQLSSGLRINYQYDGKDLSAPVIGPMVTVVIDQALIFRKYPEDIGRPLDDLLRGANPNGEWVSQSDARTASTAAEKRIVLQRVEFPVHSAGSRIGCAENVEYLGVIARKSDGIHCLSFRKLTSSRAHNVELGQVHSVQVGGRTWRSSDTNYSTWRERAAELRSFIEQIEVLPTDFG